MGRETGISWCHSTFNPWRGCTKVSAGCANCYAETLSHRNPGTLGVWGPKGTRVVAAESAWREPLKWDRDAAKAGERHRVFCASLADVFENWQGPMVDSAGGQIWTVGGLWGTGFRSGETNEKHRLLTMDDVRRRFFKLVTETRNLDYLVLTKRIENALRMMVAAGLYAAENPNLPCPQPNLWIGTSVENRATLARIDHLRRVPAAVRFLSLEPLLEDLGPIDLTGVHWVIVGGESGPGARPCNVEWIRSIVRQCREAGVACFVKQLGSNPDGDELWQPTGRVKRDRFGDLTHIQLRLTVADKKGGAMEEFPADLRVREFPPVTTEG